MRLTRNTSAASPAVSISGRSASESYIVDIGISSRSRVGVHEERCDLRRTRTQPPNDCGHAGTPRELSRDSLARFALLSTGCGPTMCPVLCFARRDHVAEEGKRPAAQRVVDDGAQRPHVVFRLASSGCLRAQLGLEIANTSTELAHLRPQALRGGEFGGLPLPVGSKSLGVVRPLLRDLLCMSLRPRRSDEHHPDRIAAKGDGTVGLRIEGGGRTSDDLPTVKRQRFKRAEAGTNPVGERREISSDEGQLEGQIQAGKVSRLPHR